MLSGGISSKSAFDGTLSNFDSPSVISKAVATNETQRDGVKWVVWLLHVRISEMQAGKGAMYTSPDVSCTAAMRCTQRLHCGRKRRDN